MSDTPMTDDEVWARYQAAEGAVIDAGFTSDTSPADAIYRLMAQRDALRRKNAQLTIIVKVAEGMLDELEAAEP